MRAPYAETHDDANKKKPRITMRLTVEQKKGTPSSMSKTSKKPPTIVVAVRLEASLVAKLDERTEKVRAKTGLHVTRMDIIRKILEENVAAVR